MEDTEAALLAEIRRQIEQAFPGETIETAEVADTGNRVFRVMRPNGVIAVDVTEAFLDADEGLPSALQQLERLPQALVKLTPGQLLTITTDGFRIM